MGGYEEEKGGILLCSSSVIFRADYHKLFCLDLLRLK